MEPRMGMVCARLLPDELLKSFWMNRRLGIPYPLGACARGSPEHS
jgi:hypothetical protein